MRESYLILDITELIGGLTADVYFLDVCEYVVCFTPCGGRTEDRKNKQVITPSDHPSSTCTYVE